MPNKTVKPPTNSHITTNIKLLQNYANNIFNLYIMTDGELIRTVLETQYINLVVNVDIIDDVNRLIKEYDHEYNIKSIINMTDNSITLNNINVFKSIMFVIRCNLIELRNCTELIENKNKYVIV